VKDPKDVPANAKYFQNAKQINMGLDLETQSLDVMKFKEHKKLQLWKPIRSMVDVIEASSLSFSPPSSPQFEFNGFPVYWVDENSQFLMNWMTDIIRAEKTVTVDLENHNSHSFLGKFAKSEN